jgi:hypothetical protein
VLLNFSGGPVRPDASKWQVPGRFRDIFTGAEVGLPGSEIELVAWGYVVLEKIKG